MGLQATFFVTNFTEQWELKITIIQPKTIEFSEIWQKILNVNTTQTFVAGTYFLKMDLSIIEETLEADYISSFHLPYNYYPDGADLIKHLNI